MNVGPLGWFCLGPLGIYRIQMSFGPLGVYRIQMNIIMFRSLSHTNGC